MINSIQIVAGFDKCTFVDISLAAMAVLLAAIVLDAICLRKLIATDRRLSYWEPIFLSLQLFMLLVAMVNLFDAVEVEEVFLYGTIITALSLAFHIIGKNYFYQLMRSLYKVMYISYASIFAPLILYFMFMHDGGIVQCIL